MSIIGLDKDYHSTPYVDNPCLFRCLGLHLGHDPKTLYAKYTDQPVETFEGVTVDELNKAETMFEVNVIVHKRSVTSALLVRRSLGKYANTMYVNIHETHFSLIHDIKGYCHSYKCSKCDNSLWKSPSLLERHELTCKASVRHVYNGGVYHTTDAISQTIGNENNQLSIFSLNCRSINANWDSLNQLIYNMNTDHCRFDFIGLTEVFLI